MASSTHTVQSLPPSLTAKSQPPSNFRFWTLETAMGCSPIRHLGVSLCALTVALVLCAPAVAQLPGTLDGIVVNENKEPVAGAEIVLTDPDSPNFKQTATTNKKGRYRILIADATRPYILNLSKPGHQLVTRRGVKVVARKRTRLDLTLRTSAAVAAANPAQGEKPGNGASGFFNRGVAAINTGDFDSAESNFKKALEKDPELHNANAALARIFLKQERYKEAIVVAELAVGANIDADTMRQVLYNSYTELGNKDKAKEILAKMQSADPSKANANLFNEAADHYNTGNLAEAKPLLEQVLAQDSNHAKANYIMGLIYAGEQVNDKARLHLEKFIELAPDDPDAPLAKEMLNYLK